jgi:hypothetical protein
MGLLIPSPDVSYGGTVKTVPYDGAIAVKAPFLGEFSQSLNLTHRLVTTISLEDLAVPAQPDFRDSGKGQILPIEVI